MQRTTGSEVTRDDHRHDGRTDDRRVYSPY